MLCLLYPSLDTAQSLFRRWTLPSAFDNEQVGRALALGSGFFYLHGCVRWFVCTCIRSVRPSVRPQVRQKPKSCGAIIYRTACSSLTWKFVLRRNFVSTQPVHEWKKWWKNEWPFGLRSGNVNVMAIELAILSKDLLIHLPISIQLISLSKLLDVRWFLTFVVGSDFVDMVGGFIVQKIHVLPCTTFRWYLFSHVKSWTKRQPWWLKNSIFGTANRNSITFLSGDQLPQTFTQYRLNDF